MRRITIKEIARKAGVSIGTVDRVLHNRGEVASKTKELVLKVAKEGNYTTNVYARSLKLNKSHNITVLLPNDNEYWATLNSAIGKASERYASLGINPNYFTFDRNNDVSLQQQVKKVMASDADGVILAPLIREEVLRLTQHLDSKQTPYVFVDSNLEEANSTSFIGQDSYRAGFLAAKLLNLGFPEGHTVYIARFYDFDSLNKTIDERINGFKDFYKAKGWDSQLIVDLDLSKGSSNFRTEVGKNENEGPVHIFVPNSRAHQLVEELKNSKAHIRTVGFDLIEENKKCLSRGEIDFIIDQNPNRQGELAVQSFYNLLIGNETVERNQLMALEIFTKENLL